MTPEYSSPLGIERRSFEIIEGLISGIEIDRENKSVLKRVIHTTADLDYVKNLKFSEDAVRIGREALRSGADIVTDTKMALAGINKKALRELGGEAHCFMAHPEVAKRAADLGSTRASAAAEYACRLEGGRIFAVGNAPTALIRLGELIKEGRAEPKLIIGVPVGFVNVVESKELIMQSGVPYIVAAGRKGGSNVAAAICNALIYMARGDERTGY